MLKGIFGDNAMSNGYDLKGTNHFLFPVDEICIEKKNWNKKIDNFKIQTKELYTVSMCPWRV